MDEASSKRPGDSREQITLGDPGDPLADPPRAEMGETESELAPLREQLRRKTLEVELLTDAGRLLGSTLDPERIYSALHQLVARIMDCDNLVVSSFDAESSIITCSYAWVNGSLLDASTLPPIPLAEPGRGMQSSVIHSGSALLVPDLDEGAKSNKVSYHVSSDGSVRDAPADDEPRARAMVMVPIKLEGQILGVAQVSSHRLNAYTQEHVALLETLLMQVGAAARNSALYQRAQKELEERRRTEAKNLVLTTRLERAMSETHHRVKNNLQVISALADISVSEESEYVPASDVRRIRDHTRTLALLHDLLTHQSRSRPLEETVSTRAFLNRLVPLVQASIGSATISFVCDDVHLPVHQTAALALLVNECVCNAVKHGATTVEIRLTVESAVVRMSVTDNGPGFPPDFCVETYGHTGMDLVQSAARWDLSGEIEFRNAPPGGGGQVSLRFPLPGGPGPSR